eukprot:1660593-Prymnesium_polylepis.1
MFRGAQTEPGTGDVLQGRVALHFVFYYALRVREGTATTGNYTALASRCVMAPLHRIKRKGCAPDHYGL